MSKLNGSNGLHAAKQLGLGATVAIGAFYFVFQILIQVGVVSPSGAVAAPAVTHQLVSQVGQLHAWHNQRDPDGVLLWYVPRSMTAAIGEQTTVLRSLESAIRHQTDVLERMDRRDERRQAKR